MIAADDEDIAEQDAGPNDEERGQPHVPIEASLARSSSSVSFAFGVSARRWGFEQEATEGTEIGSILCFLRYLLLYPEVEVSRRRGFSFRVFRDFRGYISGPAAGWASLRVRSY